MISGNKPGISLLAIVIAAATVGRAGASAPVRVVSLAPAVTETLFAIGAGAEVVGVSNYCRYPPAALRLPRVGSFLTPDIEEIAALRPTMIIGANLSSDRREIETLRAMGYSTITVHDNSVEGIERSIDRIGTLTGRIAEARRLRRSIADRCAAIRARVAGAKPRRVLMVVGHEPLVVVGPGTYLDELLRMAGGRNIAEQAGASWPHLSLEYVIAMKPQVILDGQMGTDPTLGRNFWSRYPTIPAVRDHRIYGYPSDPTLHPGPRVCQSLAIIARRIHPAAFAAPTRSTAANY